ncbi:ATP-binding sensor histidine kinase [Paraburkholderia sp. DHOC27]|uniref:trifunctional serine/threonine-protein kinase/ATP-binding protein/sensor histidine kinase n=1 Tax=Paraburkholderia sp. DHOC27 TaxID=2303330 RepID=UPI000E3D07AD|nr:ATP-binding sensor histidine kinase [Paraburkholderia sp. DHOC27]RFU49029.1 GAF domain-containing protein [Paraburkholderia sp. DHOC27]
MDKNVHILWDDGERILGRGQRPTGSGPRPALFVWSSNEHPSVAYTDRLNHEFELRTELGSDWAIPPLERVREGGHATLVFDDPGGAPLARMLDSRIEMSRFLDIATSIAAAIHQLHRRGLVHKDLKPAHIIVGCDDGRARLTGFGLASRLPRERRTPEPPETIAGTFAYMAPEQTGRMNRSVDSRSDLYAFGVTLYQMATGTFPFTAVDSMEWIHCHLARVPVIPSVRCEGIPAQVSAIIMKLLAKTPESRYQTAAGVEHDLQQCLGMLQSRGLIETFPLGEHDTPDRLLIHEKLYGREREVDTLLGAFDRMVNTGTPELVVVSGYAGIGKSSVVNELHRVLVPPRGLFAAGKFDQYKRDIPYSTLVQALEGLVRPLLGLRDTILASWREAFLQALDINARLVTDLVPDLKLIIGEPPPLPDLGPQQMQQRFMEVFRRFIGVFARAEHPLALFLDDMQWLDPATLDLLAHLLTHPELRYLLVIGAYRDSEVDPMHPLMEKLRVIRKAGVKISDITLSPLTILHLRQLIADAIRSTPTRVESLARLVQEKTAGNPFFVIQFLRVLVDEELLTFDHEARRWRWDTVRIHAKSYTVNIVELMAGKLSRLPANAQQALQQLACLGSTASVDVLTSVLDTDEAKVHDALWEASLQELVERRDDSYRFAHDRIQEAAYSLIPPDGRAEAHLRTGRLLAEATPAERREEAIFEIVGQLNRGAHLIESDEEREQLASFNLLAGERAKASTAYTSALSYLSTGVDLLGQDGWNSSHALMFALELNRAACEFLTGRLQAADERLVSLSERAVTTVEHASIACLHVDVCTTLDQGGRAVSVCIEYLKRVGITWSAHPDNDEVRFEYDRIGALIAGRNINELVDLPLMQDEISLATVEVLSKLSAPAMFTDANLAAMADCKAISISLEQGNCDASCLSYVMLSRIAGPRFGDYRAAFQFGRLGYDLVEQRGLKRFEARAYLSYAVFVLRWTQHVRACRDVQIRAFEAAIRIGDLQYAAYVGNDRGSNLIFAGESLIEAQHEMERGLAFANKVKFGLVIDLITTQLALIRMLRGLTPTFGHLDDGPFDEVNNERRLSENAQFALTACWYWIRKLQARYVAGEYTAALEAAEKAQPLLWTSTCFYEEVEYHFYRALALATQCPLASDQERLLQLDSISAHHKQLQIWAENCPDNFADRATLVNAEIARLENRIGEAELLYDQAIRLAQRSGFLQNESLANEVASRFYAGLGLEKIARVYLQDAYHGYQRWRADGKVRQLEQGYPFLRTEVPAAAPTNTIATPVERLDIETVMKVTQAVSGELVLDRLIEVVMRTALEQTGAERGLLILSDRNEHWITAEAITGGSDIGVKLCFVSLSSSLLPESIIFHVLRTRENVIYGDAATDSPFATDPYIRSHHARSILCLPLTNQGKPIGALYVENNLAAHVFNPSRIAILKLVVLLAAVALENAHLYRDLAERESKIRRLVDANIIGIFVWDSSGTLLEANDAFLDMVGYERHDLDAGRMCWAELAPSEGNEANQRALIDVLESGCVQPFESNLLRRDGSALPVIVGFAVLESSRQECIAFVLDLTERKLAEEKVRVNEQRYREVLTELAHVNRVATIGQLAASLAHEVNQPIAGIVINSNTALRRLSAEPLDIEGLRQVIDRMLRDGHRAGNVINRIRELVKKAPQRKERVNIGDAIREVIELIRMEAVKSGASVQARLAEDLPFIEGDRVELQQVLLNLTINALEAMRDINDGNRHVQISADKVDASHVLVTVSDSGTGFAPQNLERLFTPFFTTKSSGLGVGLSICHSIVEAHRGKLWASQNLPRGAIFHFTVPMFTAEVTPQ